MAEPTIELYRAIFANNHEWLEGTVADMTPEHAAWQPPGRVVPAGAHYVHHLIAEDFFLNHVISGRAPLFMSEWQGKSGFSEGPPLGDWTDWARMVVVDLPALKSYARAVYASPDSFLAGLTPGDLAKEYDFTSVGWPGSFALGYVLNQLMANAVAHSGEISCIKGMQGAQGYPF